MQPSKRDTEICKSLTGFRQAHSYKCFIYCSFGSFIYEAYCTQEPDQNPEAYAVRFSLSVMTNHDKSEA